MASSVFSSSAVASVNRASPVQASLVAPFSGLKSVSSLPVAQKNNKDITSIASNGGRVQCMQVLVLPQLEFCFIIYENNESDFLVMCVYMQVWPPRGLKKFETLSYLPDLTETQLLKEIDYLLVKGWVPCLEFEVGVSYSTATFDLISSIFI